MVADKRQVQNRLCAWHKKEGRQDLPWQNPRTPYRVWISEVMLQQTQVSTVIPYFHRFLDHFSDVTKLAKAPLDEVLKLWAGLGFYARARNLHSTAKILHHQYNDQFPEDLQLLQTLPGIGRSTAGAILALGFNHSAPILDGNVKRVLCRLHAVAGWPGEPKILKELWSLTEQYTPQKNIAVYTQAIMDLGALICTPTNPHCGQCPLQSNCLAYETKEPTDYPWPKPSKKLPIRATAMLLLRNNENAILLEKRPPTGIWGGLWSLPECPEKNIKEWCQQNYHSQIGKLEYWPMFRHTFSHFHLDITPVIVPIKKWSPPLMESSSLILQPLTVAAMGHPATRTKLFLKIKTSQV